MEIFIHRLGSPPPTRGTYRRQNYRSFLIGITPAYAGNISTLTGNKTGFWDHPRLRGEHSAPPSAGFLKLGSPPPTRGTFFADKLRTVVGRITPAYAGNISRRLRLGRSIRDHPRLRGEHLADKIFAVGDQGSPPPTRGTSSLLSMGVILSGITPAYAGNIVRGHEGISNREDHPRLRGEHRSSGPASTSRAGSPPPTRGTLSCLCEQGFGSGITPAYAGNIVNPFKYTSSPQDHPRLRGEHLNNRNKYILH